MLEESVRQGLVITGAVVTAPIWIPLSLVYPIFVFGYLYSTRDRARQAEAEIRAEMQGKLKRIRR